ncbi:hypothetical protein D5072_04560 [Dickeya dianthicola]|uniref:Uncharacterized protein n=1 Tax=Dickeya dianthicola TaxID=204039 RepID=A0AAX1C658_9GAMM|nr:hypothetical protein DF213_11025 [Dickeya dianthicola]RJL68533.1 hypothetical protein D5077_16090 [Dickeya dianthicola]RJL72230.1 hypothetical protein D5072_04560 [Dickeya dianthicola]
MGRVIKPTHLQLEVYTRHTSSCRCVGCPCSPQSLTYVSSWGFTRLPPSCTSNYFGYNGYKPEFTFKTRSIPIN